MNVNRQNRKIFHRVFPPLGRDKDSKRRRDDRVDDRYDKRRRGDDRKEERSRDRRDDRLVIKHNF